MSQCLLSLALIICYTYRFLLIDSLVEKFRSTYLEEFIDVSNLAYWDQVRPDIMLWFHTKVK